jgi:hypothetical protein
MGLDSDIKVDNTEKIDQLMVIQQNKTKFNDYVTTMRLQREQSIKMAQKYTASGRQPPKTLEEYKNDLDLGLGSMIDMDPPHMPIPNQVDTLYVEKPIGDYEPYPQFKARKRFNANASTPGEMLVVENRIIKKKFKAEPSTQTEIRECAVELTGE